METIRVNRFKVYRRLRWLRSEYLWSAENPYLRQYGLQVDSDACLPCDVLAIPCPHLPDREQWAHRDDGLRIGTTYRGPLDYRDTPMICDSSLDYAYLDPAMRELLHHPQLRYYLPGVTFRDPRVQQRRSWGGEYYGQVYDRRMRYDTGPDVRLEREPLPAEIQAKIWSLIRPVTPPFPDAVYEYITQKIRPLHERPVDLFFAGRSLYLAHNEQCFPSDMRQRLLARWDRLPGRVKLLRDYHNFDGTRKYGQPVEKFSYPWEYVDRLLDSKVVLSPWGWSPWCVRDLEALACGCVVIKPECSNLLIYPDIYDPARQLLVWSELGHDYLEGQLEYIYGHLEEMQVRADRGRQFVTEALYPRDKLYAYWTKEIRRVLELCLERPSYSTARLIPAGQSRE